MVVVLARVFIENRLGGVGGWCRAGVVLCRIRTVLSYV